MFNKSGESGHLCIVLDLEENAFNFSPLRNNICSGFVIHGPYYFEIGSLYAFLESFYCELLLNSIKSFFWTYWDDHMIFALQSVTLMCHTDWFAYTEESLHPWGKFHLIITLLMYSWNLFANILLMIFVSMFISDIGS